MLPTQYYAVIIVRIRLCSVITGYDKSDLQGTWKSGRLIQDSEIHSNKTCDAQRELKGYRHMQL